MLRCDRQDMSKLLVTDRYSLYTWLVDYGSKVDRVPGDHHCRYQLQTNGTIEMCTRVADLVLAELPNEQ